MRERESQLINEDINDDRDRETEDITKEVRVMNQRKITVHEK